VVLVKFLVIPRVLRDILLIRHIPLLGPYQMLCDILRLRRPIPICQVQQIPLHQTLIWGLLSLIQELAIGLKVQEAGDVAVDDNGVVVVLD
jgi:hypothetical protein